MLSAAELMSCEGASERGSAAPRERIITRNSSTSAHRNAHSPMDDRPTSDRQATGNLWYAERASERLINKVRHNGRGAEPRSADWTGVTPLRSGSSICPGRHLNGIPAPCDRV